jgi:histidinol dehydrogenase
MGASERRAALARPAARRDPRVVETVARIIADIERDGAAAAARWSTKLDDAAPTQIDISPARVAEAKNSLHTNDIVAIEHAVANVRRFHEVTRPADIEAAPFPGVSCRKMWRAIASCGLYVPGGTAPLVSTLIMLAEPARAAGVKERVVVTPPRREGGVAPAMIVAAQLCAVETIFVIGGAQAIAALAYGAGVPRADKIFGPGNAYVAEAKRQIAALGVAAIDLPAGPSELFVIADACADAALVAADLLSQAEHDADAQVILAATDAAKLAEIDAAIEAQIVSLPRARIAASSLAHMRRFIARNASEAVDIANAYAPEHLSLQIEAPELALERIENAGAVFMGAASAETFGDYLAGPSHVLPTDGAALAFSGVTLEFFMKCLSVQQLSAPAARALAPDAARLARLEGLEAHARAAERRL